MGSIRYEVYRHEALARKDLTPVSTLYSKAFTGRARAILWYTFGLPPEPRQVYGGTTPEPSPWSYQPPPPPFGRPTTPQREWCRRFNKVRC